MFDQIQDLQEENERTNFDRMRYRLLSEQFAVGITTHVLNQSVKSSLNLDVSL